MVIRLVLLDSRENLPLGHLYPKHPNRTGVQKAKELFVGCWDPLVKFKKNNQGELSKKKTFQRWWRVS